MASILNISAYRFVGLSDTAKWRERIHSRARSLELKGTVLLADEGINLCIAGAVPQMRGFIGWLTEHAVFADLPVQESRSDAVPFGKLVVKVKPEIVRMNHPTIQPQTQRAPAVDARTLARWLDAGCDDRGREVVMLDTRNAFEVDHGRFNGAHDWRIASFGEFPQALARDRAELEGKTVVSYCTGGIRCEKAALLMSQAGLCDVMQLEGGILGYLASTDGRHFEGNCFVFDARGTLNDTLMPVRPR